MTTQDAVTYLKSQGIALEAVTVKRVQKLGWRWYAPSAQQLLTDADVVTFAQNQRDLAS